WASPTRSSRLSTTLASSRPERPARWSARCTCAGPERRLHARVGISPTASPRRALRCHASPNASTFNSDPSSRGGALPMRTSSLLVALAAACLLAGAASADPIGPDDCSTCQGASFELLYEPTPIAPNGTTTYEITLRIDTSGYTGDGTRIGEVAFKVSPDLTSVTLLDAPGGFGEWTEVLGGIN